MSRGSFPEMVSPRISAGIIFVGGDRPNMSPPRSANGRRCKRLEDAADVNKYSTISYHIILHYISLYNIVLDYTLHISLCTYIYIYICIYSTLSQVLFPWPEAVRFKYTINKQAMLYRTVLRCAKMITKLILNY